jgi:protein-S-isoprenylcysteine O-methyltransferase Ste14
VVGSSLGVKPMRIRTALQGSLFVATVFFLLPRAFVGLNDRLGWPRWETGAGDVIGGVLILAGIGVMLHCSQVFRSLGQGTPVPIEPPTKLVQTGLYRQSRNPIYVADVAVWLGIFLVEGHLALLVYTGLMLALLQAAVVWWEEPVLAERFGAEYADYRRRVPRWLGPVRPVPLE